MNRWQAGNSNTGICAHCERERVLRTISTKAVTYMAGGREHRLPGTTDSVCRECAARAKREGRLAD